MRKIEEILRLKYEARLSHRAIAQSCSVSPSTVSEYITHAQAAGLSWPLPEGMSDEQLNELLFPPRTPASGRNIPMPDWPALHQELRRKSVTLALLWVEYRQENPEGYGYSQFCCHYRQWAKHLKPMMRQKHKAGEKLFIDYAGQTVPVVEPQTGEIRQVQIFVAVLGASNYMLRPCSAQAICRSPRNAKPGALAWRPCAGAGLFGGRARSVGPRQPQSRGQKPAPV